MEKKVEARLLSLLKDNVPEVRAAAAIALGEAGANSTVVVDGLLELTHDGSPVARAGAATALGRLHRKK